MIPHHSSHLIDLCGFVKNLFTSSGYKRNQQLASYFIDIILGSFILLDKQKAIESKFTVLILLEKRSKDCRFLQTMAGNRLVHQNSNTNSVSYHTLEELIDLQFFCHNSTYFLLIQQLIRGQGREGGLPCSCWFPFICIPIVCLCLQYDIGYGCSF